MIGCDKGRTLTQKISADVKAFGSSLDGKKTASDSAGANLPKEIHHITGMAEEQMPQRLAGSAKTDDMATG
ncbi:MAG: hypothetical protein JJT75_06720 [Opitutales bacterium]|nr:hypothetical protein [Opitutales bacterium]MCH8541637.1 hypothetical protein [Opitutales bacterium]